MWYELYKSKQFETSNRVATTNREQQHMKITPESNHADNQGGQRTEDIGEQRQRGEISSNSVSVMEICLPAS